MKQGIAVSPDTNQIKKFPDSRQEFFLRGPAGKLECVADVPTPSDERPATIVICHPHPQHGGTMHNKVVTIMERAMRELGLRAGLTMERRSIGPQDLRDRWSIPRYDVNDCFDRESNQMLDAVFSQIAASEPAATG